MLKLRHDTSKDCRMCLHSTDEKRYNIYVAQIQLSFLRHCHVSAS